MNKSQLHTILVLMVAYKNGNTAYPPYRDMVLTAYSMDERQLALALHAENIPKEDQIAWLQEQIKC